MQTSFSDLLPAFKTDSAGFKPCYSEDKSNASAHQVSQGHWDHVALGIADKNGQTGGGFVNYLGD